MRILKIHPETPQRRLLEQAVEHLKLGGVIAYPTDTAYGIGCSIHQKKAVEQIYRIKRIPKNKPLSFICADLSNIADYAHVSNKAYKLMRKLLPGPYTFILPAKKLVPKMLQSKRQQVGIRVPDHKVCLELVQLLGHPIISTTCQFEDDEFPCMDVWDIKENFENFIDMAIDGDTIVPELSTVVAIEDEQIEIIREGKGDITPLLQAQ